MAYRKGRVQLFNPGNVELMGVINVTPDSFSDGGRFFDLNKAIERGLELSEDGADYLDIGGESSRPGSKPVPLEEELRRVIPVIKGLANEVDIPISVDTYKAAVAREALDVGASIVNDISAITFDSSLSNLLAERGCPVILMHMLGTPQNMQKNPEYGDVISEIGDFLTKRVDIAMRAGIRPENIWVDPGIGFGKRQTGNYNDNAIILAQLGQFRDIGAKLVIGTSRKSFIGKALGGVPTEGRLFGSLGTFAWAALFGADILRVHDVAPARQMLGLLAEIYSRSEEAAK